MYGSRSQPTSLLELGLTSSSMLLQFIPTSAVTIDELKLVIQPILYGPVRFVNVKGILRDVSK